MKLYLDTANIDEIKKAKEMGIISGVTTNPSLIAKEGNGVIVNERILAIADMFDEELDETVSCEVNPNAVTAEQMVDEAKEIAMIHPNIVIKIPMTEQGLIACKKLSEYGIRVNMTLIFSPNQALLAARAGAKFISPFIGRLDDIDVEGMKLVENIVSIFRIHGIYCEVIAASIRNPLHVTNAALAGADIATVPFKVIKQMIAHPLTDIGIEKFKNDYNKVFKI